LKFFYKNFQAISLESKKSFLYFLFLLLLRVYLVFISRERRKNFASNFSVALSSQKKAIEKKDQQRTKPMEPTKLAAGGSLQKVFNFLNFSFFALENFPIKGDKK
jgi:hypothetical protein